MLSAIVVAAGESKRFKGKVSKVLAKINSKPVIYYSLFALNRHQDIGEIIVVASRRNIKVISEVVKRFKINKVSKIVLGGKERKDSVLQGLRSLNEDTSYVLIHDGARPFINNSIISSLIAAARNSGAAVVGVPVKPTIKRVDSGLWVKETVARDGLWEIQTPQVFLKNIILKAYKNSNRAKVTDDAMLVEKTGVKVKLVLGSYNNIKITTAEDLVISRAIFENLKGRGSS
jgi:2-C-methyl-D-erythritol 4-phosphate cytidylyltransferase